MRKIDHDAVLRARVLLLGSDRGDPLEEADAYRVLAEVSPRAYLPKLVDALLLMSYRSRDPEVDLLLTGEAVEAVRKIDGGAAPRRDERLRSALHAYQRALFALGRRGEGRAVCEELAESGESEPLARALAEEGRYLEAAALNEQELARGGGSELSFWDMTPWAANLEGAGRYDDATAVFARLVDGTRREAAGQPRALPALIWELVHLSRMYERAGRGKEAAAARGEALAALEELATSDGPRGGMGDLDRWATLFVMSGWDDEPVASAEAPSLAFGTDFRRVSGARDAFIDALPDLEAQADALAACGADRLPELVDVRRRIGVRLVLRQGDHPYRFEERLTPPFDEGVTLARRLSSDPARLARALTDRSMFYVATRAFEPAHADLAEAIAVLDIR